MYFLFYETVDVELTTTNLICIFVRKLNILIVTSKVKMEKSCLLKKQLLYAPA